MNEDKSTAVKLEELSNEKLRERLRAELDRDSRNGDAVREIVHILLERDSANTQDIPAAINVARQGIQETGENEPTTFQRPKSLTWLRLGKFISIAAVICAMVFAIPQAFGAKDIVQLIARWSDSTFQFMRPGETTADQRKYVFETDHPGLQKIYNTVTDLGVTVPVVPTWAPTEYELTELAVEEMLDGVKVCAKMECGQKSMLMLFYVSSNADAKCLEVQKDASVGEVKEVDGVTHHILRNGDNLVITWVNNCVECIISTDIDKNTAEKVLKSIYMKG